MAAAEEQTIEDFVDDLQERGLLGDNADGSAPTLAPEDDEGNIEYKLKLVDPTADRLQHLVTQLQFRLGEGQGEAIYEIGVTDSGVPQGLTEEEMEASLATLEAMADELSATVTILRKRDGEDGIVAECLVRKLAEEEFNEIRVAVVGNVDSGKSTLLGVLTKGVLDNGRGLARLNVFRHKHEIESGRTSSISQEILGFDSRGSIVNYGAVKTPSWSEICSSSSKVISFIDLAGHERYLKTTLFGLTGHAPDFCMMSVGANMGVVGMAKEHFGIALALKVPVFVVITKIDMCPKNVLKRTLQQLSKLLKSPGTRKVPIVVRSEDDVLVAARSFVSERICPIFLVSNVTGDNLDLLREFLNLLPARREWESLHNAPVEFQLDDTFSVTGVGTVVSGTVMAGTVTAGQTLLLGPNSLGRFDPVVIKSIQVKRMNVKSVKAGHTAALALKKVKRSSIRKGMQLVDPALEPVATYDFEAEILILYHSTTISENYQAVVHCGTTRQVAKILVMTDEVLRTGMRARVIFRFMYNPEFIKHGARLIFREGRTKGIGKVVRVFPDGFDPEVHTLSTAEDDEAAAAAAEAEAEAGTSAAATSTDAADAGDAGEGGSGQAGGAGAGEEAAATATASGSQPVTAEA